LPENRGKITWKISVQPFLHKYIVEQKKHNRFAHFMIFIAIFVNFFN